MDNQISKQKAYLLIGFLAVSIVFTSAGISQLYSSLSSNKDKNPITSLISPDGYTKKVNFPNVSIFAKSAVVYDLNNKEIIFEKNSESQLPLASLTKIMVALTALDLFPQETKFSINPQLLFGSEARNGIEDFDLKNILDLTLVSSSNNGAKSIASAYGALKEIGEDDAVEVFISTMNDKAKTLGLNQSYFLNTTGLDESNYLSGGYGSALDMAKLFGVAIMDYPEVFEGTSHDEVLVSSDKSQHVVENTNEIINQIPGLIASKTGFTDLAGGNLVIVFDAGLMRPIVISVLGSTREGRFEDSLALVSATLKYLQDRDQ